MSEAHNWSYHNPVRIECAPLDTLSKHVAATHVLVVTTPGFVKRGVVQRIKDILAPIQVSIWDGVKPNPDLQDLDLAAAKLRALNVDCVIGLGGGSALDAAKVLATTIPSTAAPTLAKIFRENAPTQWSKKLPMVAVPTTSGTGAEVTPFATVWDHAQQKKNSLAGNFVYPDLALLDASLTLTLGEDDTLYPAMDAISHALESLWNKNCTPVSRAFAFQSLELSNVALPFVMQNPQDLSSRQDLQTASILAGLAISQTRTAIAHSISYPLTSAYGVPHGLACSFTLPILLRENLEGISKNNFEYSVLNQTLLLIESIPLREKMGLYVSSEKVMGLLEQMITPSRANNYSGPGRLGLLDVLQQSLIK